MPPSPLSRQGIANRPAFYSRPLLWLVALGCLLPTTRAHASLLHGETLDAAAEVLSWIVIVVVPIVAITVFWLLHILPEKVAEKRKHPQAKAIQCLCLLSLFFGGLLWPLAWLWAYSKPVLHKIAYGTDEEEHHPTPEKSKEAKPDKPDKRDKRAKRAAAQDDEEGGTA